MDAELFTTSIQILVCITNIFKNELDKNSVVLPGLQQLHQ